MSAISDVQAQPHNSMPRVHIGAIMDLYSSTYFLLIGEISFHVTSRVLNVVGPFVFAS